MKWVSVVGVVLLGLGSVLACTSEEPLVPGDGGADVADEDVGSNGGGDVSSDEDIKEEDIEGEGDTDGGSDTEDNQDAADEEEAEEEPALLILHQQVPPELTWMVEKQEEIDALPFDGTTFRLPASFTIHSPTAVSVETLREEFSAYAELEMTQVTSHWLIIYASPAGPISEYQTVVDNFTNLAQVAGEVGIAGIFYDTEEYLGDTWSLEVLGPEREAAEVLAETLARGQAMAQAMAENWPDGKILITLGPWIAEPLSAAPQFLGEACVDPGGLVYNIAHANQGMGAFTLGLALGSLDSGFTFIDGAEIYTQRTLEDWERSYEWITEGFATHSDLVPAALKAAYAEQIEAAQPTYDFPSSYRCKGPTDAADWQLDIENALRTSDSIAWAYSERFEWVGNLYSGKEPPPEEWMEATRQGKAAGQVP